MATGDWHPCPVCTMAHPWSVGEKACPHVAAVKKTGLKGLKMMEASGKLSVRFDKGVRLVDKRTSTARSQLSTKPSGGHPAVDKPVDKGPVVKDAAYWRERKRVQRARGRGES